MKATSLVCCNTSRMKTSYRFVGRFIAVSYGAAVHKRCPGGPGQRLLVGGGADRTMVRSAAGPHYLEASP